MRIGIFCHSYLPHLGGVEIVVHNLARRLAARHEVVVLSSAWRGHAGVSAEDGFTVHRLPALHWTERLGVPYPMPVGAGVRDALAAVESADVLHAHGALYVSTMLARRIATRRDTPLVLTEHVGFVEYPGRLLNLVERAAWSAIGDRTVRAASAVCVLNTRVQGWMRDRYGGLDVRYVGNGVDLAAFRPRTPEERKALRRRFDLPEDQTLVLWIGRASQKKNFEAILRMPRDRFHLVVCGAERGLAAPGLTDLGVLPHARMPELFGAVDLVVNASSGEGLPLAVQEGVASGLPVILLWDPGYEGWIAPDAVVATHTLDHLVRETATLAGAAEPRAEIGARARAWAEQRWSWDATVAAYEEIYRQAAARRR